FFPYIVACMARRCEAQYAAREGRHRQARFMRPRLEALEERIVPDAYMWTGAFNSSYTDGRNWLDTNNGGNGVPGSLDTADIPAGSPVCILSDMSQQTVAGLTVEGSLEVDSKLSVTTLTTTGTFSVSTDGEVDVLGSGDLGGTGTISGQIDSE